MIAGFCGRRSRVFGDTAASAQPRSEEEEEAEAEAEADPEAEAEAEGDPEAEADPVPLLALYHVVGSGMAISTRHVRHQWPVLGALARSAVLAVRNRNVSGAPPKTPGPWFRASLPPRDPQLIRDYIRHVGGDPSLHKRTVPAHLFPQWTFPLQAQALEGLPYPMQKVLNGGCLLEQHTPLPQNERLEVATRLDHVDDDGRRAVLRFLATTGTKSCPDALTAHLYAIVPLAKKSDDGQPRAKKVPVRVPDDAREVGWWKLRADAGLDFAKLTGDFNPVHWVPPYARAFGFRSCILHGFSTFARTWEGLRTSLRQEPTKLDVRFTKPLLLPARVGLYLSPDDAEPSAPPAHAGRVFVGDAPSGPAYLEGTYA